jgi:DNA-binding CsgD family transcriptional regulator
MGVAGGLAGRHRELRVVTRAITGETDRAALLVVGEAGIGKSRLIAAAVANAAGAGVTVLTGWCLPLSGGLPYLPVADVLRGLADVDSGQLLKDTLAECPGFVRDEVSRLLPGLEAAAEPPSAVSDDGWRRRQLLDALRHLIRAAAQLRRTAIVIEDVHWADAATVELLDYLLVPGHATGVPMVVTCRAEETPPGGWVDRVQRNDRVDRLDLAPLTLAETAEQIELLLGERPAQSFVGPTFRRSEGNAFFTEQLVWSAEQGDAALPAGLTSLLLSRTAAVTGAARDVLEALAVAGRPLDEPELAQVCARDEPELRDVLRDLLSRRLLRAPDAAGRHELRHALLAEAVSRDMLPGARRNLHLEFATMMAGRAGRASAAQIAEHLTAAARPDDELHWRVIAAQEAETVFAAREAAAQWRRAVALWDEAADADRAAGIDIAQMYLRAASATENAGDTEAAAALAEEALARLTPTADPDTAVSLYWTVGRYRGIESVDAGLAALGTAIQIGAQRPSTVDYVKALSHYSHLLYAQGRLDEQRLAVDKGLQAARQIGDSGDEKILLMWRAWLAMHAGDRVDARAALDRAEQIVTDDPVTEAMVAIMLSDLLLKSGDLDGAVEVGMRALTSPDIAAQSEWFGIQMLRSNISLALVELGDIDRAATIIDPVTSGDMSWDLVDSYEMRAVLDLLRGELAAAKRIWDQIGGLLAEEFDKGERHAVLALRLELSLWAGDPDAPVADALTMLADLVDTGLVAFAGELFVMTARACADCTELARARGDTARLRDIQADSGRLADLHAAAKADPFAPRPLPVTGKAHGRSWHAEWTRLRGEHDPQAWHEAAAAWEALSRPHRAAYARWRQAEALLAQPYGRAPATEILRTAARQAAQHLPLSAAISELAHRARIDVAEPDAAQRPEEAAPAAAFGLTDREHAVLLLLGQGRTNAQIGKTLFISTKTASVHVSNIIRKLGVATRVEAAAVAARAGLLEADDAEPRPI